MDAIGSAAQNLSATCHNHTAGTQAGSNAGSVPPSSAERFNFSGIPAVKKMSIPFVSGLFSHGTKIDPVAAAGSVVEEAYAIPAGVVGGALGMSLGILYDLTIIGPLINGAEEAPYGKTIRYIGKEFLKPFTLMAKGAKRFHNDARNAMRDELAELGQYGKDMMKTVTEDTEKTLLGEKKAGVKEFLKGLITNSFAMSCGLIGGTCAGLWGMLYSGCTIAPLIVADEKAYYDRKTTFGCYLKETMAPVTWGLKKAKACLRGGKEAMEETLDETGDIASKLGRNIADDARHALGIKHSAGFFSRVKRVVAEAFALPMGLIGAVAGAAWGSMYSGSILFPFLLGSDKSCYSNKSYSGCVIKEFLSPITYSARAGYCMYDGTRRALGAPR